MTCPAYVINQKHRSWTRGESQWQIECKEEEACFASAHANGWVHTSSEEGWGLHVVDKRPQYVGVVEDLERKSFYARFVNAHKAPWHGYGLPRL